MQEQPPKNRKPFILTGVIIVLIALAVGAYFLMRPSSDQADTSDHQHTSAQSTPAQTDTASNQGNTTADVQTIQVEAGNYYFKPNEIRVKKGQRVKIVLATKGMGHDFVIDSLGVEVPVTQPGETNSVEFTATTPGTYEFYCSVGNHRQLGQVGTLIVE